MVKVQELEALGAPRELVERWAAEIDDLTEVQERAVRAGVLGGTTNLLVVAPTSSGKTLIGEMAASAATLRAGRRRSVFIVPFRALADEHFDTFRSRYGDLLTVTISTSDWTEFDEDIRRGNFHIAVMTYEKLTGFLVQDPSFLERLALVVIDEVQTMREPDRGPGLEILITRVLRSGAAPQLIALSASLDQLNELHIWLRAQLVHSSERPVPLVEGVCDVSGEALFSNADPARRERLVPPAPNREQLLAALCREYVARGAQLLVFRATVGDTLGSAHAIVDRLPATGIPDDLARSLAELEESEATRALRRTLASGVAFHNAELTAGERRLVEAGFRNGAVRVLVSTTTLAMGVNLPTDVVVVADARRPDRVGGAWRDVPISVIEYKNAAGRAGRLGRRVAGTALLLADDALERDTLFAEHVRGAVEPVTSQIPAQPLADLVFELLCGAVARSVDELTQFIAATFAFQTFYERVGGGLPAVRAAVEVAVRECVASGLIVASGAELVATQVARSFAAAGVSLRTAVRLARILERLATGPMARAEFVYEIAERAETGRYPFAPTRDPRPDLAPSGEGCDPGSRLAQVLRQPNLTEEQAHALTKAACLMEWMEGRDYRSLALRYRGAGRGRLQALGRSAAWLLETVARAGAVKSIRDESLAPIRAAALEARYGLPAALAPLARLRVTGISRENLRALFATDRPELYEPHLILDERPESFAELLSSAQVVRLKEAILAATRDTLRRQQAGHVARAERANLPLRIVGELYNARSGSLEQAVTDALEHVGLTARRQLRQPQGEADVLLEYGGTVVISVTASADDARPVPWDKVREVLGAGAGLNPVNYVCVARPSFHPLGERHAREIEREQGPRKLLLVPINVLAEAVVRCAEGTLTATMLADLLAGASGVLDLHRLDGVGGSDQAPDPTGIPI